MNKPIAQILLPVPFDYGFDYFIPENMEIKIGDVVKVSFRSKEVCGIVFGVQLSVSSDIDEKKIKTIISKEERIKFSPELLRFIDFVANYNLIPKGLVLKLSLAILNSSKEVKKKKAIIEKSLRINLKPLNKIQQKAADDLLKTILEQKFSTTLLDGITGSGKTEIYFQAIASSLRRGCVASEVAIQNVNQKSWIATSASPPCNDNAGKFDNNSQILILLPEIALTSQLCKRFEQQFGFKPDLWHSKISPNKKRDLFFKVADGSCQVLIGARSSLFLPFKNLQLIIVDEEHDASFKQEDIVNYQARDMAIMRAKLENIPIILSSATPSLETYLNAKNGKYQLIRLNERFGQEEKTTINLLDMRQEKLAKDQFICDSLKKLLEENLNNNRQSLLFLNRRGYAPLTLCKKCGQKVTCKNCSSYLTMHQKVNRLVCHHCGMSIKAHNICNSCGKKDCLINCGVGVEKLQEEVLKYFPKARIGLMSSDNIKNNSDAENLIEKILNHEIDIIIGTQMIAKGHHFPSLALVGIIDADSSFNGGNLRALERSFQLLTQVIGRAGRENFAGQVLLQTYNPENSVFKSIIESKRDEFLENEILSRKAMNFPPFSKMASIIFSGKDENLVIDFAKFVLKKFSITKEIEIFGPAPMPITRVKNLYHYCLNIKVEKKVNLQKLIIDCLNQVKTPSQIRVKIDIDPI
jgi:primosomal protein N' (replication factor Y)